MAPQTPVSGAHKDLRIHLHVKPTVCYPPTRKYQRMGFIGLDDAELEILIKRGARNRVPLVHGAVSAIEEIMAENRAADLAIYQSVGPCRARREVPPTMPRPRLAGRSRSGRAAGISPELLSAPPSRIRPERNSP